MLNREELAMTEHDDFCEAEYVPEAGGSTACACDYRATRGLVAQHDAHLLLELAEGLESINGVPFTDFPLGGRTHAARWLRTLAIRAVKENKTT